MKKKLKKKAVAPTKSRIKKTQPLIVITHYRIIGLVAILMLFGLITIFSQRIAFNHAVAGANIVNGLYNQATVTWQPVTGAAAYDIYYKSPTDTSYVNSVRNISKNITTYTISYLKKGTGYTYEVAAKNAHGAEFWKSSPQWFTNITSM